MSQTELLHRCSKQQAPGRLRLLQKELLSASLAHSTLTRQGRGCAPFCLPSFYFLGVPVLVPVPEPFLGVEVSRPGVEGVELLSRPVEACRGLSRPVEADTMLASVEGCRGVSRGVEGVEGVEDVERVSSVLSRGV